MRKSLKNHSEVAHIWAQQNQEEGYCNNMFFEGKSIFSYGHHFEMARFISPEVVFLNSRSYSNSTAKHQDYTRSAVSHKKTFSVVSFTEHSKNVAYFLATLETDLMKAFRGRADNTEWRIGQIQEAIDKTVAYVALFKKDISKGHLKSVKEWAARRDSLLSDEQKAKLKDKIKSINAVNKFQKEQAAIKAEEKRLEVLEDYKAWQAGSNDYLFSSLPIALRLKNETIQTTKGAEVPLIEARKLWHALQERKDVSGMGVGHYTVTGCDRFNLTVGCHTIPLKEVVRMGIQLGWQNQALEVA